MQPHPEFRRFEGPGEPEPPAPPKPLDLPVEGKGIVLNRDIPCPCTSCAGSRGGHVASPPSCGWTTGR